MATQARPPSTARLPQYFQNGLLTCMHHPEPVPETVAQLAQEVYASDLLYALIVYMGKFEFEVRPTPSYTANSQAWLTVLLQARKDVAQIFTHLLRRQIGTRWPTVEYLNTKDDVIFAVLRGLVF